MVFSGRLVCLVAYDVLWFIECTHSAGFGDALFTNNNLGITYLHNHRCHHSPPYNLWYLVNVRDIENHFPLAPP